MLNVRAFIKLYQGNLYRKTPFASGYKPSFNFVADMKKTGKITLLDKKEFTPGEEGEVEIAFLDKDYLGNDFGDGKKFTFSEGTHILGEGRILKVIN
ncbi:MAG: hypothetical protein V5804_05370 [Mucilaginibacter sp.]|uniref:hypothetical protein n=1 Tax=Mucilaginibacter sp. TaxID=1882438 RepID=UPI0034E402AB